MITQPKYKYNIGDKVLVKATFEIRRISYVYKNYDEPISIERDPFRTIIIGAKCQTITTVDGDKTIFFYETRRNLLHEVEYVLETDIEPLPKTYTILWEISEIDAGSPREAAEIALEIQRNPESIATLFTVVDQETNERYEIDFYDDEK